MQNLTVRSSPWARLLPLGCLLLLMARTVATGGSEKGPMAGPTAEYATRVRPLIAQYCLRCHSHEKKKGDLDLERFTSLDEVRKDIRPWQTVVEMLDNGEMPPKKYPQPRPGERRQLLAWVRGMLDAEARSHAGDPGRVVVRRLSNAEYNNTIRDLAGLDLQPACDFPGDGAAGEGFTNAGDALVISPTLLNKYLNAAKDIAAHAVLLPDGFRFSPSTTRRDWTDEVLVELRKFYGRYSGDGRLPVQPYLAASVRYREDLIAGRISLEAVAAREHLNSKYLHVLWQGLNDHAPSFPLDQVRTRWRQAKPQDVEALAAQVAAWQGPLWRFVPIGSYRYGNTIRQLPNDPVFGAPPTLRLQLKPAPGQTEVVLYLTAREFPTSTEANYALWQRPRFEGAGKPPLLLRDYAQFGDQFELDYRAVFADTGKYLAAALEAANNPKLAPADLAQKHGMDAALLAGWLDYLALATESLEKSGKPPVPVSLLGRKLPGAGGKPRINGWGDHSADTLPIVVTNASDQAENIPGTVGPHKVAVHPTPTQFVAVAWNSPIAGQVRVGAKIAHAHPACGNGIAWWLEHRRGDRAARLAGGTIDVGKQGEAAPREIQVGPGDVLLLAVGARDGNHACDLTAIELTIAETGKPGRTWDLARDVADNILEGNPHADKLGNKAVWQFVKGPDPTVPANASAEKTVPSGSVLARWRSVVLDGKQKDQLGQLAGQVQKLLTGARPTQEGQPDRLLYDALVSLDSPLFRGIDLPRWLKARRAAQGKEARGEKSPGAKPHFGLERTLFGRHPLGRPVEEASLAAPATSVLEVRLPAALFRDREFVVEGTPDPAATDRAAQFQVLTSPPALDAPLNFKIPCVASPGSDAVKHLLQGFNDFRRCFPQFVCYPRVIPDDEVVCLKLYHREDEALVRLFLDEASAKRLDRLWAELRFISQYPVTENRQLPLFIGFVTQDQPKELLAYFESQRGTFRQRAEEFDKDVEACIPAQLEFLTEFAARGYRRPLEGQEKAELVRLYQTLRQKGLPHEEAFRIVLTRVLIAPSFLFRIERPGPGTEARPVSNCELATRLSYFLWASMPDAELRRAAAAGRLQDPKELAVQVARMLKDPGTRGLATEFATQWLHVRDIRENREKNERLFPTFDDNLRQALFEESVRFFQDLFQNDRPLHEILDADSTFLNETLAKHYGIPNITGPEWRRVTGVKKFGRGGILTMGSVLTRQSGASRTSPVLRGNWLVEVLLGEQLPKPPPNVPRLPEGETGDGLTVRQMVEKHAAVAECAVCHRRIDPFGFALEKYDPIGRFRDKDSGGRPIDTQAQLKDGTQLDGVDGLRNYLLTQRREVFLRQFSKKLLGYALGRSVTSSDQPLIDEMLETLKKNDQRASALVLTVVLSKQFRYHRGLEAMKDE